MRTQRDLDSKSEEGGNSEEVTAGAWRWAPGGGGGGQGLPSHPEILPLQPACPGSALLPFLLVHILPRTMLRHTTETKITSSLLERERDKS